MGIQLCHFTFEYVHLGHKERKLQVADRHTAKTDAHWIKPFLLRTHFK